MTKKIPMRQCVGCGKMQNKKEMLRILKTPEDQLILDATGKQNGRGAYICRSRDCFLLAKKNKGLERSLKRAIGAQVYEELLKEFEQSDEQT